MPRRQEDFPAHARRPPSRHDSRLPELRSTAQLRPSRILAPPSPGLTASGLLYRLHFSTTSEDGFPTSSRVSPLRRPPQLHLAQLHLDAVESIGRHPPILREQLSVVARCCP